MNKRYFWLAAAILWCMLIFITASSPSITGGSTSTLLQQFFSLSDNQVQLVNLLFRKCGHLSAYGFLAFLLYFGLGRQKIWPAWLLTTIYAATDEIHQAFLPDRTGAVMDVGIDSVGALLTLSGLVYIRKKRQ